IEGGVSDAGIPYIAMELVDGAPITRAADARAIGLRQRLQWFTSLCRTIEAAHAALVVHRDIKPSNILVTHDDRIKVLDFGIAKLLDEDSPVATRTLALTPEYAAPEQFGRKPITAATDVYALGMVLGELLVGERLPPHRRASSVAAADRRFAVPRGMPAPHALGRLLEGDLDAILDMATAHDARGRYATAAAFADDVERYLAGEPVHARPLTRRYRAGKFVGRHRAALGLVSFVVVGAIAAFVAILWQADRAREQAVRAEEQARRAETVRDLLVSVFNAGGADLPRDHRPGVEDIVAEATGRLMRDTSLPQAVRADLLLTLARVARSVGSYDRSIALLDLADRAIDATYGAQSDQRLEAMVLRADAELAQAHYAAAQAILDPVATRLDASTRPFAVDGLIALGSAHIRQGRGDAGLALLQRAVAIADAGVLAPEVRLRAMIQRATALVDLQKFALGLAEAEAAVADWHAAGTPPSQSIIELYSTMALAAEGTGDIPRAEHAYLEAIQLGNRFFDKPNPATAWTVGMYGSFLAAQGRLDEAEPYLVRGLELRRSVFGTADPRTLNAIAAIGKMHAARRHFDEAARWYTQAVDQCTLAQVQDVVCSRVLAFRARALAQGKEFDAAERDIAAALEQQKRRSGDTSPAYAFLLENKVAIDMTRKDWQSALDTAERIFVINANTGGGMIQSALTVHFHHARALFELGRIEPALRELEEFEPQYARLFPNGVSRFDMLALRARALGRSGRAADAREAARQALALKAPPNGYNPTVLEELRALANES
ncbi:MAG: protein kinase domain-containing protein, partial [Dokdonella sp.]|uniref:protein kinase domain-containing protein n=1 Tax=Dokdonella sp. TaxID=2291710 RepID=UPI003F800564